MYQLNADDIRLGSSLLFGLLAIPNALLFALLWLVGRVVTRDEDRHPLGLWFGRFSLAFAVVMACVATLLLNRWADINPDYGPDWIASAASLMGSGALIMAGVALFKLVPLVMSEFENVDQEQLRRLFAVPRPPKRDKPHA